jgi:hypothetical protein
MEGKAALIHAAFKGLAEGLMAAAGEPVAAPTQRRRTSQPRRPKLRPSKQLPLSPEMDAALQEQFVAVNPRGPATETPSAQELDDLFRGNEAVEAFARQMKAKKQAAEVNPAPAPEEGPTIWGGIPDR